jgi:hypothetical protein
LDVVKLIASFDRELASYLDDITRRAISKKARIVKQWPGEKTLRARGNCNMFLSKTMIETVYTVLARMLKEAVLVGNMQYC